jgi:hypothetical protein
MTQEEFEKRIGLEITSEEYEAIEAAYTDMGVNKDRFVKIWRCEGGMQRLFDNRLFKVSAVQKDYKHLEMRYNGAHEWMLKMEKECGRLVWENAVLRKQLEAARKAAEERDSVYATFDEYEAAKLEIIGGVEYSEYADSKNQYGYAGRQYGTENNGIFFEVTNPNTGEMEFWSTKHPESRYYRRGAAA